jgi:hypothetical protein
MAEDTEHDQLSDLIEIQLYELPKMERKAQAILEGREEAKSLLPEEIWGIYFKYHQDEGKVGLIKELTREDEGLMSTERVLERVSRDREEWARALSRELGEMTYRSDINNARKEGYKQAEAEIQTARQQAEEYRRQLEEAQAKLHEAGL